MIKNSNNLELDGLGIDAKYYLLYQVWKELTERKTMDSYQYHIMNTLEALRELTTVIGHRLNRYHNTNHNIDECKSETRDIVLKDSILQKYYPCIRGQLISHLSGKTETDSQQRALRYQIEYCYNILNTDYFKHLLDELEADIRDSNKSEIVKKANMVISNCASRGWSTIALHNLVDILLDSKTDQRKWQSFKDCLLLSTEEMYYVYVPLKVTTKITGSLSRTSAQDRVKEELQGFGIALKTKSEIISTHKAFEECALKTGVYMAIPVEACDYYSATYKAIDKCTEVLNILSFYNFIEAWDAKNINCWAINIENSNVRRIRAKDLYETYEYLESTHRIYRAAKSVYFNQGKSVKEKLHDVYAYSNMAKSSGAQEEKFMNTWIALESFCRGDVYDNIISNVLETVPPALCLRYVYQHFRNFIEDAIRCSVSLVFSTMSINISPIRAREEMVKEIIEVFSDSTLYSELLTKCSVNDLLVHRCEYLHDLVTNSELLFGKIERHYLTVRRQLSRLYRIRNDIAHNAMTSTGTIMLYIEHLDDYLVRFVSEVIMCADKSNVEDIEVVFEIIKDNYKAFLDIIHNKKITNPTVLLDGLLRKGIIDLI